MKAYAYILCGLALSSASFAALPQMKWGQSQVAPSTNAGVNVDASTIPTDNPTTNGTTNPDLNSAKGVYVPPANNNNLPNNKTQRPVMNNSNPPTTAPLPPAGVETQ